MNWTREQVLMVMNLYLTIPFGKLHSRNPEVIALATAIGRTPSAVALKLVNLASFDPELQKRGIKGMGNASKLDMEVWNEFKQNWSERVYESEVLRLATVKEPTSESIVEPDLGREREATVRVRVNQTIFRKMILASYNSSCCITGISEPRLLVASHILPWSQNEKSRLDPANGLCLNNLHDKAYEVGLISVRPDDFTLAVSEKLKGKMPDEIYLPNFEHFKDKKISLPNRAIPNSDYLAKHYNERFSRS
jgi:putative restriction endonuclease